MGIAQPILNPREREKQMDTKILSKPGRKKSEGKRVTMIIPHEVYNKLEAEALGTYRTIASQAVFQICEYFNHEVTKHDN